MAIRGYWLGVVVLVFCLGGCGLMRGEEGSGEMGVRVDEPVAADRPVMLMVTLRNTGKKTMTYWCGGPGRFPGGQEFVATIAAQGAAAKGVEASNGQYRMGSGVVRRIMPGESIDVPLALAPLVAGRYDLELRGARWSLGSPILDFEVPGDEKNRIAFDAELMTRIHADDLLAEHVAKQWPMAPVQQRLLGDVLSPDGGIASRALGILRFRARVLENGDMRPAPLPEGTTGVIVKAINRLASTDRIDGTLAVALGEFVAAEKLEAGSQALIPLVKKMRGGQARMFVVRGIAASKSPAAAAVLHDLLHDADPWTRFSAASELARRHDAAAVPTLLELAKMRVGRPGNAFYELSYFPDVPEAVAALQRAKSDPAFADDARQALKHMEKVKKNPGVQ